MHYRFLVTFDKHHAKTSQDARDYVIEYLHAEHFCCGEGRWACGIADWFVIGGRWSGELSRQSWARDLFTDLEESERHTHAGIAESDGEQHRLTTIDFYAKKHARWQRKAPKAYRDIPYPRDAYKTDGYADDAMLVTHELYDGLLQEYELLDEPHHYIDCEYDAVDRDMVGNKWLVVVDYHM